MKAKQLFDAGDLSAAISAATEEVKAQPGDMVRRTFLFELLCFAGELDRAQKQFDVLGHQDAKSEWGAQVYGNLLHAERTRRAVFNQQAAPEFLLDEPDFAALHLAALNRLHAGRTAEARAILDQAAELCPTVSGKCGETPFDHLVDGDDVLGPFLELMMIRDYIWVPLAQIRELEITKPERPRDLLWTPARIVLSDGSQRRGYAPALYPNSHEHADDLVKLGRMTDWKDLGDGVMAGVGQHSLFVGQTEMGLLELRSLELQAG